MKAFIKGITMQNNMTTFTFMLLSPEYSRMEFILLFMQKYGKVKVVDANEIGNMNRNHYTKELE